jgi:3-oxoacyl-[acyl-carrier-protein] synthase-3
VQAVCSGFVYALTVADSHDPHRRARTALVIGAEVFSRILDFNDRTTCVLFGDGAGAVVLEASDEPGILATELHADGRHAGILCVPGTVSGGRCWATPAQDGRPGGVQAGGGRARRRVARSVLAKAGRTEPTSTG